MQISRATDRSPAPAEPDYFTGEVTMAPLARPDGPSLVSVLEVTFQPGARTNWHTHPVGQTLIVTQGRGWIARDGADRMEVGPGDVVRFAPGERHWHGATADSAMTHIAIQEAQNGTTAVWADPVSDADYGG